MGHPLLFGGGCVCSGCQRSLSRSETVNIWAEMQPLMSSRQQGALCVLPRLLMLMDLLLSTLLLRQSRIVPAGVTEHTNRTAQEHCPSLLSTFAVVGVEVFSSFSNEWAKPAASDQPIDRSSFVSGTIITPGAAQGPAAAWPARLSLPALCSGCRDASDRASLSISVGHSAPAASLTRDLLNNHLLAPSPQLESQRPDSPAALWAGSSRLIST